jgi:hypothetical protein
MSILVTTPKPNTLVKSIKQKIDEEVIVTWLYDNDGDFSHSPDQWEYKAWLRPIIKEGMVIFKIIAPIDKHLSTRTYAVYHGRFIEMLLSHFDGLFSEISASSLPSNGDEIRG